MKIMVEYGNQKENNTTLYNLQIFLLFYKFLYFLKYEKEGLSFQMPRPKACALYGRLIQNQYPQLESNCEAISVNAKKTHGRLY